MPAKGRFGLRLGVSARTGPTAHRAGVEYNEAVVFGISGNRFKHSSWQQSKCIEAIVLAAQENILPHENH